MSVSAVARAMGVSYAAVYGWVKKSPRGDGDNGDGERRNPSAVDIPNAEKRRSDGYEVLGHLPAGRRERGKGSEVNRNEGLRAKLRTRLNRLGRSASGYSKKLETLANSLALARLRERLI